MKKAIDYPAVGVVFFCHDGKGKVLLGRRSRLARDEQGAWDPGGGGLHIGERLLEALEREIDEEYGATIVDIVPLGYREVHRMHEGEKTHWISFDYAVQVDPTTVTNREPAKCEKLEWFTFGNFPHPMHSKWSVFLEKYQTLIKQLWSVRK